MSRQYQGVILIMMIFINISLIVSNLNRVAFLQYIKLTPVLSIASFFKSYYIALM